MDQKEIKDIVLIEEFLKRFNVSVDKFCDSVNKINERIEKMEDFEINLIEKIDALAKRVENVEKLSKDKEKISGLNDSIGQIEESVNYLTTVIEAIRTYIVQKPAPEIAKDSHMFKFDFSEEKDKPIISKEKTVKRVVVKKEKQNKS